MDDLISEFITETSESIQLLDSELVKLENEPNNEKILGNIFRLVHTIKGTCGFLGLPRLESVAHAGENVLGKVRDKVIIVSPDAISLVLKCLDRIKSIIEYLSNNSSEPEGSDAELIKQLNDFADSNGAVVSTQEVKTEPPKPIEIKIEEVKTEIHKEEVIDIAKTAIAEGLAATENKESGAGLQNQSIRVSIDVLENLMQMVGELVLTRNQLLQIVRNRNDSEFTGPLQHLSHITSELQEGIMKTRMQPISNAWSKFPRLIRDLSHELNKKIDLKMIGAETELDRQLLEMIKDPLTHMVRNSADHGLEMPADRAKAGKTETGTVTLSAYHEGGHIIIDIADDGRGLNINRIKEKIITNALATPAEVAALSDQQLMQYIFRAGFSTAEKVTSVSGRGVGMDVVRTNIERIGGTIDLSSELGKGSKFSIKIPLTLAIVSVLLVSSGEERFALPQINVQELVRVGGDSEHHIEHINSAAVLRLRGKLLPLLSLADVLQIAEKEQENQDKVSFIVVCKVGGFSFGLVVERVFDTEEIVVKPTSEMLKHIDIYSGNTILGDGSVIMILDPNGLARATGENEIIAERDDDLASKNSKDNKKINFLLFTSESDAPKAVPLELVSRLEEIDMTKVEMSGDQPVVQYHDDLMRLCRISGNNELPKTGTKEVIVFTYDGKIIGLVVDEIMDIVSTHYDIKMAFNNKYFIGSMVIDGKTTDIVNVSNLLGQILGDAPKVEAIKIDKNRILMVEDSPFFRSLTVPFITSAGYNVIAVGSAQEGLALLEKGQEFDIIVSDIEMPEMDGFAFAEACKNNPKFTNIPMIAFSSTKNENNLKRVHDSHFSNFILKTDRAALLDSIADTLAASTKENA
jgi:two-component system, chemotaxis family, sensor kinase CheA